MDVRIASRQTVVVLRIIAALLFVFASFQWKLSGFIGALVVVFLLDRFWPKWGHELSWYDMETLMGNLAAQGFVGGRIHMHLPGKKLFVYRDMNAGAARLSVIFFLNQWIDLYGSQKELRELAAKYNCRCKFGRIYGGYACRLIPKSETLMVAYNLVRHLVHKSGWDLEKDIRARSDSAKRNPWKRYDDIAYPSES
jgi:hypothetical protein